jgi:hypothetical protein
MLPFQTPGVVAAVVVGGVLGEPVGGVVGLAPDPVLESLLPPPPQAVNARLAARSVRAGSRETIKLFMIISNGSVNSVSVYCDGSWKRRPPVSGLR